MKNTITPKRLAQILNGDMAAGDMSAAQRRSKVVSLTQSEMLARQCTYDEAFRSVILAHPELASNHPSLANDEQNSDTTAGQRTNEIQKWIKKWCEDVGLDPADAADYKQAFAACIKEHPEWGGHIPVNPGAKSQSNSGTGDKTPPRPGKPYNNLQSQRPAHVTTITENPAQRAQRIREQAQVPSEG